MRLTFAGLGINWRKLYTTWAQRRLGGDLDDVEIAEAAE
jgi:hypothetical protein